MDAKLKILCTGNATFVELDGKTIGKGVESIEFCQGGGKPAQVKLSINLDDFCFLPDGYFNEVCQKVEKASPPEGHLIERTG